MITNSDDTCRPVKPTDKYFWHVETPTTVRSLWGAYPSVDRNGTLCIWGIPGRREPEVFPPGSWTSVRPVGIVPNFRDDLYAMADQAVKARDEARALEFATAVAEGNIDMGLPPGYPIAE